jgi:hypothetical protein
MSSQRIRSLLWLGSLGAALYFVGDMLCYGGWGPGHFSPAERMAGVALWRLHLESMTAPIGTGCYLLGAIGVWYSCRRSAPRMASVMLAALSVQFLFGGLWHGSGGPLGFVIQCCGVDNGAVVEIRRMISAASQVCAVTGLIGFGIWIVLALKGAAGVPRWSVVFAPVFTLWLRGAVASVPAPLGLPLAGGWGNISFMIFFAIIALTYRELGSRSERSAA